MDAKDVTATPSLATASADVRGALDVARRAVMWSRVDLTMHPALRYYAGLSIEETAEVLDCSQGNVKSQSVRGLAHLRQALADDYIDLTELIDSEETPR